MKKMPLLVAFFICSLSAEILANEAVDRGIAEFKAGQYRAALKHLQPPAEAGNAEAQLYMGRLYAGGRAGVMDDFEAANWFEKSARQDNAVAQYHLARLYLSGWGLSKDPKAAMEWLWKSGRLGFVKAQLLLGDLLSEGKVVPQDLDAARLWYAQAANQGSIKGREQLDKLGGAAALPDGGEGLKAETKSTPEATRELNDSDRAAIVRRRIEELKSARKGEASAAVPVAAVATAGATAVVVTQGTGGTDSGSDATSPDEVVHDEEGDMEVEELVLEEFATDDSSVDEALASAAETAPLAEADAASVEAADGETTTAAETPVQTTEPQQQANDLHGHDWVMSRSPAHYTIQLLGSWTRADALAFVDANPLPGPGALVETRRRGKPWFSLYYGDFASFSEAAAEQSALKGGIAKHGPWVRPYRKIQDGLK